MLGSSVYLRLVWYHVEIFFSPIANLRTRIKYGALVSHFLGIWRNFIVLTPGLNLKSHFITRECYQDLLLSTHFAVMLICYYRDNFPHLECPLHLTGSEPCEVYLDSVPLKGLSKRHLQPASACMMIMPSTRKILASSSWANCKACGRRETEGTWSTDNLSDLMTLSLKTLKPLLSGPYLLFRRQVVYNSSRGHPVSHQISAVKVFSEFSCTKKQSTRGKHSFRRLHHAPCGTRRQCHEQCKPSAIDT